MLKCNHTLVGRNLHPIISRFIQKPATSKMSQSTDVLAYTKFDVTKFASNTEIRPNRVIYIVHIPHATEKKTIFFIHGMGGRSEQWNNQVL